MRVLRAAVAIIGLFLLAAVAYVVAAQRAPIATVEPPSRSAFAKTAIENGARLAAIGDCHGCHTVPGGMDYVGNRPISTPFGTIYSTNITPALGTGIGHWSEAAFRRAMREGISRSGAHLYPVFPYDHFTRLNDDDIAALYAFIMTRRPVETDQKTNALLFPLGQRWLLAFWNLLFFHAHPDQPDPQRSAEWNRGAYLVAGLGHCGACHTPRNLAGAEESARALAGGDVEGWSAPALDAASPAPLSWDAAHLFHYLRHGWDAAHGVAAGPMQEVIENLAAAGDADIQAIAAYLATQQGHPQQMSRPAAKTELLKSTAAEEPGAAMFAGACARCHVGGPAMEPPHGIDLSRSTAINAGDPRDAILTILDGIRPNGEQAGPFMPPFADTFTDAQLAALLAYVRQQYSAGVAWPDLESQVRAVRKAKGQS